MFGIKTIVIELNVHSKIVSALPNQLKVKHVFCKTFISGSNMGSHSWCTHLTTTHILWHKPKSQCSSIKILHSVYGLFMCFNMLHFCENFERVFQLVVFWVVTLCSDVVGNHFGW